MHSCKCRDKFFEWDSNVRIRNSLRTFKWEGQTIKFEMNDIYCVTKEWGGQICEFIALEWEGKS